ncbi:methyl- -binding domain-containing 13 isoform X1 [Olea europaea subsp. europaea]|uniref:Methyl- -binding domain-containing 13 isoform X1 n=2 Tax=Olea europaea subsp. europaea TaxID=158383 RepID=A0A8S0REM6_OLEEU|nr:methyl- -binding domain-containing 13 isoform X1 [Olea europaea subsp. europaea]
MSDHPDWLPAGWKIKIGVRQSGKKDKYYIDPSNKKFNSKPEVLRYLKNAGSGTKHTKSRKLKNINTSKHVDTSKHSASKIDIKKTVAENLPPGWVKEIRIKRNGSKTRSDPTYIDPVSGRHFRSMPEVFRYLEARDSEKVKCKPKDKGSINAESGGHSQSVSSSSGAKRQRWADKKEDKYVTGDQCSKPGFKDMTMNNANILGAKHLKPREVEDDSVAGDLRYKLQLINGKEQHEDRKRQNKIFAGNEVEKNVNEDQSLKSGSKGASTKNNPPEANDNQQSVKYVSVAGDFSDKLSLVNKVEQHEDTVKQNIKSADNEVDKNANGDPSLTSGLERAEKNNDNMPEANNLVQKLKQDESVTGELPDMQLQVNRMEQHENGTNPQKRKRLNSKTLGDLPRRTSKRLAKIEVDRLVEVKPKNEAQPAALLSGKTEVNGANKFCNHSSSNGFEKLKSENSDDNKQKRSAILPLRDLSSPKPHAGDDHNGGEKQEMPIDTSFNDLLKDPCIEFAIKTLTGAIPIEDVNKFNDGLVSSLPSSSAISVPMPPGDVWADPCFEFAVKTLTGEVPMVDNSHVQNSSNQPLDSSETSRDNGLVLPNFRTALHRSKW